MPNSGQQVGLQSNLAPDQEDVGLTPISADPAARPPHHDLGISAPNPHAPKATAHRPATLHACARSLSWGWQVRVAVSLGRSFSGEVVQLRKADPVAGYSSSGSLVMLHG